jgi:ribosome-associated protein
VEISIGEDMIRLGQLLKYANVAGDGAEAKFLIATGAVSVDGQVETQRGRQVHPGAVVGVATSGQTITLYVRR